MPTNRTGANGYELCGIQVSKLRPEGAMPDLLRAAERCKNTFVAANVENKSLDLHKHAQTTPHAMGSTPICGRATGVMAMSNATAKGYKAAARQSVAMWK